MQNRKPPNSSSGCGLVAIAALLFVILGLIILFVRVVAYRVPTQPETDDRRVSYILVERRGNGLAEINLELKAELQHTLRRWEKVIILMVGDDTRNSVYVEEVPLSKHEVPAREPDDSLHQGHEFVRRNYEGFFDEILDAVKKSSEQKEENIDRLPITNALWAISQRHDFRDSDKRRIVILSTMNEAVHGGILDRAKPWPSFEEFKSYRPASIELAETEVLVWQLETEERRPEVLREFWSAFFEESGAHLKRWSMASLKEGKEDRHTAILVDSSNAIPKTTLTVVYQDLLKNLREGERLSLYNLGDGTPVYPRPIAELAWNYDKNSMLATLFDDFAVPKDTKQSPILEYIAKMANSRSFSIDKARKSLPGREDLIFRRIIVISDLEQNVRDSPLEAGKAWPTAQELVSTQWWARNKPSLDGVEVWIWLVPRSNDGQDLDFLEEFWTSV